MKTVQRWTIREYDGPSPIIHDMALRAGLSDTRIKELLTSAGERAAKSLGLTNNPISVEAGGVRATDVAGIVRVAPAAELEIVPKFLPASGPPPTGWREDFFFLANLSKHGRLLLSEKLAAGRTSSRDIPSLVGQTIVAEYLLNRRRPLRSYRRSKTLDFAVDGEVDPEAIVLPDPDGFLQDSVVYDRQNMFNATIAGSARRIAREARNPGLQGQLLRVSQELGHQKEPPDLRDRRLPNRARKWQPLFDLSRDVLRGFGVRYDDSPSAMPGFVVSTWRLWEDIITLALRLGLGDSASPQLSANLGSRKREGSRTATKISVTPDITLSTHRVIVDAKYKTRQDQQILRISEADLYEALAFSNATGISVIELVYPASSAQMEFGAARLFETVEVSGVSVRGVEVSIAGISKRGMLRAFGERLSLDLLNIATGT